MEKSDPINKTSFKEGAYPFYRDFILETIFSAAQRRAYTEASDAYDHCFLLAKQNNAEAAAVAYQQCCALRDKLDPAVAEWVTALCEPRLSYYNYKTKDYATAILATKKLIGANQLLQKKGYQLMYLSEIQQLHNLSRIYFSLNETEKGVGLSLDCLLGIYEHAAHWKPGMMMNGISEAYLITDLQYAVIVQVMTETFIRLLRTFKTDTVLLDYWLRKFTEPLSALKFALLSSDYRYKHIDALVSFLQETIVNKDEPDYTNLLFVEKSKVDRLLSGVLYEYITFSITENEKALLVANA